MSWTTPTLFVSRTEYGSSADMIDWSQQNLSGHWGLKGTGAPLHRLRNAKQRDANRQALCGSGKFTKDPAITDDTCDEFPFAATYESGALNGVDHGKDCAQVTAVRAETTGDNATDWPTITPVGPFTGGGEVRARPHPRKPPLLPGRFLRTLHPERTAG
ncbi:hypothetical protein [Streptomyces sp. NPDC018972]|uniref:NucA/NucB deoxyribonuclease domain-containing protein n=1 Tax=Streptomyces sp. NPDC018972 TaxID=3365060 RepID=UPI0037890D31